MDVGVSCLTATSAPVLRRARAKSLKLSNVAIGRFPDVAITLESWDVGADEGELTAVTYGIRNHLSSLYSSNEMLEGG